MNYRQTLQSIKQRVRDVYAWPGGYEMHLVMADGEMLCMECARKDWKLIYSAIKHKDNKDWQTVGADIYWEGPTVPCVNCNAEIKSQYGDPNEEEE